MPKKGCCSCNVTSCCAQHNYTNNVAMIGDLLVDDEFKINAEGEIERDDQGDPILIEKCQVSPIHKDDELILFQRPFVDGFFGDNSTRVYNNGQNGNCKCFYGYSTYRPQRTRTIRQKYKYIGCQWTWYPPKFLFNYDQNIPQCGIAAQKNPTDPLPFYANCFDFTVGLGNAGNVSAGFADETNMCPLCTQINPMVTNSDLRDNQGNYIFNIWGDVESGRPQVSSFYGIKPIAGGNGWSTQFISSLYPGHGINIGYSCCTCTNENPNITVIRPEAGTSCWMKSSVPVVDGECLNLNVVRSNVNNQNNQEPPLYKDGGIFYSTFENRINGRLAKAEINESSTFIMGQGTDPAYFVDNRSLPGISYIPSSGGYSQNNCTYCSLSPYLRDLAHNQYTWAYDLFCAGRVEGGPAKTYNFPLSFIKTGMWNLDPSSGEGLKQEKINGGSTDVDSEMEQWTEVLGEHTFYSQLVGMVQLEHYWEYTGVNKSDLDAAVKTIPYGIQPGGDVQNRWNYWLQRTTPRMFVLKSSATPLFIFDLVYADRLGIFKAFADPDQSATQPDGNSVDPPTMTIAKFLAYFSTFSNSYSFMGNTTIDGRGRAQYPPGCDKGYKHVRIVKEILDAMSEAGIIGTRDHRQAIYNEIKQIIETGIENGRNGAYYKPWAPGNPVFVTPSDFDKLYAKYYTPYQRMCTPKEMFPEEGDTGLGLFGPIRKIIPPSYLTFPDLKWNASDWKNNHDGEQPPAQPPFLYMANTVDPDDIFNEKNIPIVNCRTGGNLGDKERKRKIQNLQFSKYYGNGYYNVDSPDYVNSQLFFRAIPGRWSFVKWASMTTMNGWCNRQTNPCSAYEIYGAGSPPSTGEPGYLWHSEGVRTILYNYGDSLHGNGYPGMCNGINPKLITPRPIQGSPPGTNCGDNTTDQINTSVYRTSSANCGFQSIAWDASGAPSTVRCTPVCTPPNDSCCNREVFYCGCECSAIKDCANQNIAVNGNSNWNSNLTCEQLFGRSCCQCIGRDPEENLTVQEYIDLLTGPERKCETCGDDCNFGCPDETQQPFTFTDNIETVKDDDDLNKLLPPESVADDRDYIFKGLFGSGDPNIPSIGDGESGGGQNPCEVTGCDNIETGPQLGVGACDPNCGYNGIAYDKLAFVLQQNNYNWSKNPITSDGDDCPLCTCSGYNTCYVRFAGKVQNYLPNAQTGFYEPQESNDGNLFDTGPINMETPIHLVPTSIDGGAGKAAVAWLSCSDYNTCGDPASKPCVCNTQISFNDLLCPGAVAKAYTLGPDCNIGNRWCGYYRSGRVILGEIKISDVLDQNYEYV
jgi:hypothetical protein